MRIPRTAVAALSICRRFTRKRRGAGEASGKDAPPPLDATGCKREPAEVVGRDSGEYPPSDAPLRSQSGPPSVIGMTYTGAECGRDFPHKRWVIPLRVDVRLKDVILPCSYSAVARMGTRALPPESKGDVWKGRIASVTSHDLWWTILRTRKGRRRLAQRPPRAPCAATSSDAGAECRASASSRPLSI